ncbi:2Fe-2S iron-sulfur cluster-binding protein [Comamonas sp. J-3]|uniref:2Fe-2S iron-sulfur cluster-binding protein n=1 Tax=Comamonas trifloxystrobinivorans TaxID=3350256 RepID=UPI00372A3913
MNYRVLWLQTQQSFEVGADESVLDAATRQGVDLPHDCTFGGCGTCRMKVEEGSFAYADGELPLAMSDEEHAEGYALACQARAQSDLVISVESGPACSAPTQLRATVAEIRLHTPDIYHLALDLPSDHGVQYAPGQYLNICLPGGEHRSFSMSSPQQGNRVTLQIRKIAGGRFTEQMLARTQPGDVLDVELPHGTFYYHAKDYQPMVFAATGTGFAPIKAILESLLDDEDCPPIHFYWGMRSEADLYLLDEIAAWAGRLYEFTFVPVLSRASDSWAGRRGYVQHAIAEDFGDLSEHSVYLCGSPSMIQEAKALLALSGAALDKIYSDSFVFQNEAAAVAELNEE